jgi:hypothetical protein
MFGFGSKKQQALGQVNIDESLLKKDIFSARDAQKMGVEARNQKRNNNRREIFRQIKLYITAGNNKINIPAGYFDDGNDVYFEGLGYKVKTLWIDSYTGAESYEEPAPREITPGATTMGMQNGTVWHTNQGLSYHQPYTYSPTKYVRVSWE